MGLSMKKLCLFLLMGGLGTALTSCGNAVFTESSGQVGFSLNETGGIVINVETCGAYFEYVDLVGPNIDDKNYFYVDLWAKVPIHGYVEVDISNPGSNWRGDPHIEIPQNPDELLISNSGSPRRDVQAYQVAAKLAEIRALKPGEILISTFDLSTYESVTHITTREEFSRCD